MEVFRSSQDYAKKPLARPLLALGNFDGVHVAHQAMFQLAKKTAKKLKSPVLAYTFEPHPVKVLSPKAAPPLIQDLSTRLTCLKAQGLDGVILEPFKPQLARLSPQTWFEQSLVKKIKAQGLVAGYDFTFGAKRAGTVHELRELCQKHSITCEILEAQFLEGTLISSSRIRKLIAEGEIQQATKLLGRPFSLKGNIIPGAGRGRALGTPTANLQTSSELLPPRGVYATRLSHQGKSYPSVTNIGFNPTFGGKSLSIESHLLEAQVDLYGQAVQVDFIQRLREEKHFPDSQSLVTQIKEDIKQAKKILKTQKH